MVAHARADPSRLMSTQYNHNLGRVRTFNSFPIKTPENPSTNNRQEKTESTLVSPVLRPSHNDPLYNTKSIVERSNGYSTRSTARVYHSPFQSQCNTSTNQSDQQPQPVSFDPTLSIPAQLPRSVKTDIRLPGPEIVARFLEPTLQPKTTYQHSFKDITYHEKKPSPPHAMSRSATTLDHRSKHLTLTDIQERWSKTQALRQYHEEYPEPVPDVGGITVRARKALLIADTIAKKAALTIR